jgi:hypothetical protein
MLPLSSLFKDCAAPCCSYSLQIIGDFDQPEYYIGQLVMHCIKRCNGEILHPVRILGVFWTGMDWQYAVSLPEHHPWFEFDDREVEWLDDHELEAL